MKSCRCYAQRKAGCRSREGAWIEMLANDKVTVLDACRSREGAWIEMISATVVMSAVACRSREGAWIEILTSLGLEVVDRSLP